MEFEWDENKNRSNQLKHGLSFETAVEVFSDWQQLEEAALTIGGEDRRKTIGRIGQHIVVIVVHVLRRRADNHMVIRVISARKASREERLRYDRANT